jgi:hypothetical protein
MTTFQSIFLPLCAAIALLMLARTIRGAVGRRNGAFWTMMWSAAAFFIAQPSLTTTLAGWLGIGRGADLVLYSATLSGLAGAVYFYQKHRHLEIMVTGLIRREALEHAVQGRLSASGGGNSASDAPTGRRLP